MTAVWIGLGHSNRQTLIIVMIELKSPGWNDTLDKGKEEMGQNRVILKAPSPTRGQTKLYTPDRTPLSGTDGVTTGVPKATLPSTTGQGQRNTAKGSWVEIRTGREHSPNTIMVDSAWGNSINLLPIKIRAGNKTQNKFSFPRDKLPSSSSCRETQNPNWQHQCSSTTPCLCHWGISSVADF